MAQDRAHGTDLVLGPESSPQQTHCVQELNPLALVPVSSASRNVLPVPCVDHAGLQSSPVEDFVQSDPIDAGGLHGYRGDPATLQPVRHPLKIFSERAEASDRFLVGVVVHGHEDLPRTDIDSCRTRLFYRPVAETQASVSLSGHAALSFLISGSQGARN
jgi:hypothetical protein